ncbi:LOW QUALITY PROTEIN: hypothetical protein PanWU01x14_046420 [Parasponia andersonii]|uniref:Uncharacterized protein n=1 Tax=Parasponia andersonii TaxID=3476 RepID=A0A2P5DNQ4_PARAD|nr:LOW QUALITY PROTEIN: hypothetical protein PanWU01x14_046420 [Parasponia andersonii]
MREVKPGDVGHGPIGTASGECEVECAEALGDVDGPSEEDVGDYTQRSATLFGGDVLDEFAERRLERDRTMTKIKDSGNGQVLGVLMIREGKLGEEDIVGGIGGVAEVLEVEGGGGDGDGDGF